MAVGMAREHKPPQHGTFANSMEYVRLGSGPLSRLMLRASRPLLDP